MTNLEGRRTFISLFVLICGVLGLSDYIAPEEIATIVNSGLEFAGTLGVIYYRYVASKQLNTN